MYYNPFMSIFAHETRFNQMFAHFDLFEVLAGADRAGRMADICTDARPNTLNGLDGGCWQKRP
jgi:hypothetical protein